MQLKELLTYCSCDVQDDAAVQLVDGTRIDYVLPNIEPARIAQVTFYGDKAKPSFENLNIATFASN